MYVIVAFKFFKKMKTKGKSQKRDFLFFFFNLLLDKYCPYTVVNI